MSVEKLNKARVIGENVRIEFKRCGAGIEIDTYETVCSFLNRFGGDIYLGVEDDGTVRGVSEKAAPDMVKNFINMVGNPDVISPTVYLEPNIFKCDGMTIIHIHIPVSSDVHTCKKVVLDRVGDSDVKVKGTNRIAEMYIRKHDIFTERRVYKYVTEDDLRLDMIPRLRQLALNRTPGHPWKEMGDIELLKSAGLYGEDKTTGDKGYNLAAVMLLGKDDVIRSVVPAYRTDALLRRVNLDRYDDRLMVQTNLIESFDRLMGFAEKHLLDKFYLESSIRVSLRDIISREILANTLIHREFTSSYVAKFVIEKNRMYTENANRAGSDDPIEPDDFEPNSKNPIVAAFFRNIGIADELGSGTRKLFKYTILYSGKNPQMIDGDVFRTIVPLDDNYSFDAGIGKTKTKTSSKTSKPQRDEKRALIEVLIIDYIKANPQITQKEIIEISGKSKRAIQDGFADLQARGLLVNDGTRQKPAWVIRGRK